MYVEHLKLNCVESGLYFFSTNQVDYFEVDYNWTFIKSIYMRVGIAMC